MNAIDTFYKNNKHKKFEIRSHLLWEYDLNDFGWQSMRAIVVERVLELGNLSDFVALFQLYGKRKVRDIIKNEVRHLTPKTYNFTKIHFNLKDEDMLCYKNKIKRDKYLNS